MDNFGNKSVDKVVYKPVNKLVDNFVNKPVYKLVDKPVDKVRDNLSTTKHKPVNNRKPRKQLIHTCE